jgi:hypothetical protein
MRWGKTILFFAIFLSSCLHGILAQVDHWETIVFDNDTWKYFVPTSSINEWNSLNFDDTSWPAGQGGFGFGDNDDTTSIPTGTICLYQRIAFNISDPSLIHQLVLNMDYDDGFIAYLNGTEIARGSIDQGVIPAFNEPASGSHEAVMYNGVNPEQFVISNNITSSLLLTGNNVLAIATHNQSTNSSDFTSRAFLHAGLTTPTAMFNATPNWFTPPFSFYSSNLPIVVVDTYGVTIPDEPKINGTMGIIKNSNGALNSLSDDFNEFSGLIAIERRGSSSNGFPAKSYGLETRGPDSVNYNASIFDWPADNDWILYAPYTDKSLMRNVLIYQMGRDQGRWAPRTEFCELVLNGEYMGVYVFMERIKVNPGRVDIDPLLPADTIDNELTGGYIFKVDKTTAGGVVAWESPYFGAAPSNNLTTFQLHDPDIIELHPSQLNYIQGYVTTWENILMDSLLFNHPLVGYSQFIDPGSFIDFFLANEITKNVDGYRISTFLYKERLSEGGKIHAGPLWDFNIALGNSNYCNGPNVEGWEMDFNNFCAGGLDNPFWWHRLLEDSIYANQTHCRWQELRQGRWSDDYLMNYIDSVAATLEEASQRHFQRWPILGNYVWPNNFIGNTYQEEIDYLKSWIVDRTAWMDSNMFGSPCDLSLGLNQQQQSIETILYPNPIHNGETLHIQANQSIDNIALLDGLGKTIFIQSNELGTQDQSNSISFSLGKIPAGLYTLKITQKNKVISFKKILVL